MSKATPDFVLFGVIDGDSRSGLVTAVLPGATRL